jgi:hypothetical protein
MSSLPSRAEIVMDWIAAAVLAILIVGVIALMERSLEFPVDECPRPSVTDRASLSVIPCR